MKEFVNGFTSWHETHFEVVDFLTRERLKEPMEGKALEVQESQGTGGFYELAEQWTDEFELKYKGVEWGVELEYFDTIEEFLKIKNLE
jgi:hypothetical protein